MESGNHTDSDDELMSVDMAAIEAIEAEKTEMPIEEIQFLMQSATEPTSDDTPLDPRVISAWVSWLIEQIFNFYFFLFSFQVVETIDLTESPAQGEPSASKQPRYNLRSWFVQTSKQHQSHREFNPPLCASISHQMGIKFKSTNYF